MVNVATSELRYPAWVAMAFTVVAGSTMKGPLYSVLEMVGVSPSVV